tara:strand:+ start:1428 stop:2000 length:573 start_codon:yes stop_codon:yes gene_type:complete
MSSTQIQIESIHTSRKARSGKVYTGPGNVRYSGSKLGHLIQEALMEGDVDGTTLKSRIARLGKFSVKEIEDAIDSIGSKGRTTITGARRKKTTDSYLELNGVFMNEVPIVVVEDSVITSISVSTSAKGSWVAEVHNSMVEIPGARLESFDSVNSSVSGLNIGINKGSRLMLYVNGEGVEKPRITITYNNK